VIAVRVLSVVLAPTFSSSSPASGLAFGCFAFPLRLRLRLFPLLLAAPTLLMARYESSPALSTLG